uniref:putative nuclease HARBI1 n=1 Tax=Pristiophorus japonicus TaxID=55135 RepID=UPI00398ED998
MGFNIWLRDLCKKKKLHFIDNWEVFTGKEEDIYQSRRAEEDGRRLCSSTAAIVGEEPCQQQSAEAPQHQQEEGEAQHVPLARRSHHPRVYRCQFSFLQLSNEQCVRRLRFTQDIVTELCNVLRPDLEPHTRLRTALSRETKVTIALNFYATGLFQSASADISNISQFSAHHSIWQVTNALYKKRLQYISCPMTREKQLECQARFVQIAGFPRMQGAIDCTYIGLRAPQHHPELFIKRKGSHSLNVQLVCDHQQRALAIDAKYPDNSHDAFIPHQSNVPALFTGPSQDCGWLHGDKGYPLSTWLLTPLCNPRTAAEHAYNDAHSGTRCIIEHCISILKQRLHCLDHSGGALQYLPKRVSIFVVVSAA